MTEEPKLRRHLFDATEETRICTLLLDQLEIGEVLEYETILKALNQEDIDNCRHCLYSAMNALRREHLKEFTNVRKLGYKRINDREMISSIHMHMKKSVRSAKRGRVISHSVDIDNLSMSERTEFYQKSASCAFIEAIGKRSAQKALEGAVRDLDNVPKPLNAKDFQDATLNLLKSLRQD